MTDSYQNYGIDIPPGSTGEVRTLCPECSHTRKKSTERCLSVNTDKGTWLCHHCSYSDGLKSECFHTVEGTITERAFIRPKPPVESPLPDKVLRWFLDRGISDEILYKYKIAYGPVWMPSADKEVNAIQFPYFVGGETVNIKYRDGRKNFRMVKGAERVLYGLNDIVGADSVFWVEGEIDKLSLAEAGYPNCVSVPDGAPSVGTKNYSSKFSFLEAAQDQLEKIQKHYIAVDNDEPGVKLKNELIRRLGPEKCFTVDWPCGCKDANDTLVKFGCAEIKRCLKEAKPVPVNGLFTVEDFRQSIFDTHKVGYEPGISTGWDLVDKHYTVRAGEWTVVTGIPGHGKSEFLDALMVNLALNDGWRFGVCSMENRPLSRHASKLIEKYTGKPFRGTAAFAGLDDEQLKVATNWLNEHFYFIAPDEGVSIEGVLSLAGALVSRHGVKGLILDPWNEFDHSWGGRETETMYISAMLTKIRLFARNRGVHVWVVAHPTKLQKGADGQYPVPTPYDIAGAAHWRNKADNAITIHRPNVARDWKDKTVEVHVQKIRFKEIGRPGCAKLKYDWITGRYEE